MHIDGVLYTREVAEQVGSLLQYQIQLPWDGRFFRVTVVHYSEGKEQREEVVSVRPIDDIDAWVVEKKDAQGNLISEIVHCVTSTGKRISFVFGPVAERTLAPATVFYES